MTDPAWHTPPEALAQDQALIDAVLAVHREILRTEMVGELGLNLELDVQQRAFRHIDGWSLLLLLTPWMLARLLIPDEPPALGIPAGWSAEERRNADYTVLGPVLLFELLGQPQRAHLNYHPALGHYLLQPICLDMEPYREAEAVFEAWNRIIRTRDENMEKAKRDCPLQKEVSRREFFGRWRDIDE